MTWGDELLLLAIDPGRRRIRGGGRLRFALRAAEVAELAAEGRISLGPRRIDVVDPARLDDRRLNNVLHVLAGTTPAPSVEVWLRETPRSLATEYLSRLQDQRTVRVRRSRGRNGRTRHDILSVDVPRREALVAEVDAAVRAGSDAESSAERALVLAALVQAADLARTVYPGLRGASARRRLARLVARDRLASAAATASAAVPDRELADALSTGIEGLSHRLHRELSDLYADFTTGGHGLGHDLDPGAWSGADASHHHTGGHHASGGDGGGHHGGGHHGGGGDGW